MVTIGPTFASLVKESFDQIRGSAEGNEAVLSRMLGALQTIASVTTRGSRRQVLREQMEWLVEVATRTVKSPHDRTRFVNRLEQVRQALDTAPPSTHERP